jgi:hypothetical protein
LNTAVVKNAKENAELKRMMKILQTEVRGEPDEYEADNY